MSTPPARYEEWQVASRRKHMRHLPRSILKSELQPSTSRVFPMRAGLPGSVENPWFIIRIHLVSAYYMAYEMTADDYCR